MAIVSRKYVFVGYRADQLPAGVTPGVAKSGLLVANINRTDTIDTAEVSVADWDSMCAVSGWIPE